MAKTEVPAEVQSAIDQLSVVQECLINATGPQTLSHAWQLFFESLDSAKESLGLEDYSALVAALRQSHQTLLSMPLELPSELEPEN